MMRKLYGLALILFAIAVLVFCVQNIETVTVAYLGWKISLPLPLLVVLIYLLGMISGWGVLSLLRRTLQRARETTTPS